MTYPQGLGLGIPSEPVSRGIVTYAQVLGTFRPAWWHDWTPLRVDMPGNVPMLRRPKQGDAQWNLAAADVRATGRFYLLGNEPNNPNQAAISSAEAAQLHAAWRQETRRQVDGTWQYPDWAGWGLLIDGSGGGTWKHWIESYYDAGGKSPPWWHVHIYATDAGDWTAKWNAWLGWLWANKDTERSTWRPIVISETGPYSTYGAKGPEILDVALDTMQSVAPLQGVAWFSALYGTEDHWWKHSDLAQSSQVTVEGVRLDYALLAPTVIGSHFRNKTHAISGPVGDVEEGE